MNDGERRAHRLFATLDAMQARQAEDERRAASLAARPAPPDTEHRTAAVGPTLQSPAFDERSLAPAQGALPAGPPSPPAVPAAPPIVRAPLPLPATGPVLELPASVRKLMAGLPFLSERPGPHAARTVKLAVMRPRGLAETAPVGEDAIAGARAVLPFMASTAGPAVVPFPDLTLDQYTSFCAELAVRPERWAAIFPRYHVLHEAARGALDAHWQRQLAAQPELRAAFDKSLPTFIAYVRTQPG